MIDFDRQLQLAWFAGLVDGEGWIGIGKHSKPNGQYHIFPPCLVIQMTDKKTLDKIVEITGIGKVFTYQKTGNRKPTHMWRVQTSQTTLHILKLIEPYLVTKKQQAQILIDFIEKRIFKQYGNLKRTQEDIDYCERYFTLLKSMNLRGKPINVIA